MRDVIERLSIARSPMKMPRHSAAKGIQPELRVRVRYLKAAETPARDGHRDRGRKVRIVCACCPPHVHRAAVGVAFPSIAKPWSSKGSINRPHGLALRFDREIQEGGG
jgi:hypothetical protein